MAFLLWAAVRFGTLGSTCSLSAISALAVFGIFAGGGPFVKLPLSSALQPLQLFLIVISFPLIALATVVQQQRNVAAALRVSEERLHQLSARLIDSLECERKLVSRQLHEDMAQRVAALGLGLSGLSQNSAVPEGLAVETARLRQHAADIVQDLSLLSNRLGPPSLETLGLSLTLEALCAEANSHPDLSVTYEHVGPPDQLPWDIAVALYRVVQESLNNALAHSGASNISVVLFCSKETCQARISDDGSGFDLESAATYGFGIAGMNARMRGIGGSLVIHTWPGHGTEIIASIPSLSLCLAHAR